MVSRFDVFLQIIIKTINFPANFTFKSFFLIMIYFNMLVQTIGVSKTLQAHCAFIRFLIAMSNLKVS